VLEVSSERSQPSAQRRTPGLKRAVSELGALTRDLHRIAYLLAQEGGCAAPEQPDLRAVARLCQTVRSDTKALISANVTSWEIGRRPRAC
jgi:hypothetical protein